MTEQNGKPKSVAYTHSEAPPALEELIKQAREQEAQARERLSPTTLQMFEELAKQAQEPAASLREALLGFGRSGRVVEEARTVALAELEKITAVTSGSYNAALDLRDTVAVVGPKLGAEDYGRLEVEVQNLVTYGKKAFEEVQGIKESVTRSLDMLVAAAAGSKRTARRVLIVSILALTATTLAVIIAGLDTFGWIAYWRR